MEIRFHNYFFLRCYLIVSSKNINIQACQSSQMSKEYKKDTNEDYVVFREKPMIPTGSQMNYLLTFLLDWGCKTQKIQTRVLLD